MRRTLYLFAVFALPAGSARPQGPPSPDAAAVRGDAPQTRKRLAEIQQKIRDGDTAAAADDLYRVIAESGDDLISADGKLYTPARAFAHQFLCALPPAALKPYRDRTDAPAAALLAKGKAARDPRPLRQLVDRYFASRPAEEALLLLGELAFERGEFAAAETYWRRLTPDVPAGDFAYPDPAADPAGVRSRIAVAALFRGDVPRATKLAAAVKEKYPLAAGRLAGRTGIYADTLAALLADPPRVPPDAAGEGRWAGLGGSPSRDGRVTGKLPLYWPTRPTWTSAFPADPIADLDRYPAKPPPVGAARCVGFHPVVIGDTAYVADAARVTAFDLDTGRGFVAYDIREDDPTCLPGGELKTPLRFDADFSLTAAGGKLYARLGSVAVPPPPADPLRPGVKHASYLVCLTPTPAGLTRSWFRPPPGAAGAAVAWEAAPVVIDGRILAAYVRSDGGRVAHGVACLDDAGERMLWATDVADAGPNAGGEVRYRHQSLTVAGSLVVFCTHTGAVVALDPRTGKTAWAFRYPRVRKAAGEARRRDVNPVVAAGSRVYVAPTDAEFLYCLDAETGRPVWQDGPLEIEYVAGAAGGKIVCVVAGPVCGVRAYAAETGSLDAPDGWANHDDPRLPSFGRMVMSDDVILWPTHAGLVFLRAADGRPCRQPVSGPHGNLAFANGTLLCATPTELWGYRDPQRAPAPAAPVPVRVVIEPATPDRAPGPPRIAIPLEVEAVPPRPAAEIRFAPPPIDPGFVVHEADDRPPPDVRILAAGPGLAVLLADDRTLTAVDPKTGRVAWHLDAAGRPRYAPFAGPGGPTFLPHVVLGKDSLVAFTTAGRRLQIAAATGTVRFNQPGPAGEFVGPGAVANGLLIVPTGPAGVEALDPVSGDVVWRFDARRETSSAGLPPQIAAANNVLFVGVKRNTGVELDRLAPADGTRLWTTGPAVLPFVADVPSADADTDRVYVPGPDFVSAFHLDTGVPAWTVPLPLTEGWRVVAGKNAVVVVPKEAVPADPLPETLGTVAAAFARRPTAGRVVLLGGTLYDVFLTRSVPVIALDPATGKRLGELALPARGPRAAISFTAAGVVVETEAAAYRLK